jgi:hypothetical protein
MRNGFVGTILFTEDEFDTMVDFARRGASVRVLAQGQDGMRDFIHVLDIIPYPQERDTEPGLSPVEVEGDGFVIIRGCGCGGCGHEGPDDTG